MRNSGFCVLASVASACSVGRTDGAAVEPTPATSTETAAQAHSPGYVDIPAGSFVMGHVSDRGAHASNIDHVDPDSRLVVDLAAYSIDRNPVTNRQYKECVDAHACPDECQASHSCSGAMYREYHVSDLDLADYPMATAMSAGADAYCRWMGKRLPTEAEWERAARGREAYDYPWGTRMTTQAQRLDPNAVMPARWSRRWASAIDRPTDDVSVDGVRLMVTGVPELVVAASDGLHHSTVLHGNLSWNGLVALDAPGSAAGPLPAWARRPGSIGGFRCAWSADSHRPDASFFAARRRLIAGQRLQGER